LYDRETKSEGGANKRWMLGRDEGERTGLEKERDDHQLSFSIASFSYLFFMELTGMKEASLVSINGFTTSWSARLLTISRDLPGRHPPIRESSDDFLIKAFPQTLLADLIIRAF